MARVPKPAKTSEIFLAPGHELTFPSHVQDLIEKIAAAHILKKTSAAAAACLHMVDFVSPWQGSHFSMLSPKLGREILSPHPFTKKESLIRPSARQIEFSHATARASPSHLEPETWPKTFVTRSVLEK